MLTAIAPSQGRNRCRNPRRERSEAAGEAQGSARRGGARPEQAKQARPQRVGFVERVERQLLVLLLREIEVRQSQQVAQSLVEQVEESLARPEGKVAQRLSLSLAFPFPLPLSLASPLARSSPLPLAIRVSLSLAVPVSQPLSSSSTCRLKVPLRVEVARSVKEARPIAFVLALAITKEEQETQQESEQEHVEECEREQESVAKEGEAAGDGVATTCTTLRTRSTPTASPLHAPWKLQQRRAARASVCARRRRAGSPFRSRQEGDPHSGAQASIRVVSEEEVEDEERATRWALEMKPRLTCYEMK